MSSLMETSVRTNNSCYKFKNTVIIDCFKFQQMRCVVYHSIQQEVVGKSFIQN